MTAIRSLLFNIFFFGSTFVLTLAATLLLWVAPSRMLGFARWWASLQVAAARIICGIRLDVTGRENLPDGPVLIAARHESAFDILAWMALSPRPCFVVKQELTRIPVFGALLPVAGMIVIDRDAGAKAMRGLLREAEAAVARGQQIIIFPEGTRCEPGVFPDIQPGIVALAARTGLNIVPAATNAGLCWGRNAFSKHPGTVRIAIAPALERGLARPAILERIGTVFRTGL